MPKVKVERQSTLSPEETFKKIRVLLEDDKELRQLDAGYKCVFNDQKMTGTAKGGQFEAEMKVTSTSGGAHVQIEVSLPFLLTPIKGMVQSKLQKKLDSTLS
jgi:hypothetical protein